MIRLIPALLLSGLATLAHAETIAIVGAKVHTLGPQGDIDNATIVIRDGRIAAVSDNIEVPADATRVDAAGKVVTPGIFSAYGQLGLTEVSAVDQSVDFYQSGSDYTAAFDIADAYNPRSTLIAINRAGGVTRALTAPAPGYESGSVFSGLAAVIRLGESEPHVAQPRAAMVVNLGNTGSALSGGSRAAALLAMRTALDDAIDYRRNKDAYDRGQRRDYSISRADLEALQTVVAGRTPLVVNVHRAADISVLADIADEYRLKVVVYGGAEAWMVADRLAQSRIAVILDPKSNLPASFDQINARLESPAILADAGVEIAFGGDWQTETYAARNATQAAGNAVSNGLSWSRALAAITIGPARMFGVDDLVGSIEAGKEADLVIWGADPLELTSNPEQVIIGGERQSLVNRQTLLRDRYLQMDSENPPAFRH